METIFSKIENNFTRNPLKINEQKFKQKKPLDSCPDSMQFHGMTTAFSQFKFAAAARFEGYTADAIGFFEAIAIEGLEGQFIRIPAAAQRRFFGKVVFGKLPVKVDNDGTVTTLRSVAYGRDWNESRGFWSMADRCFLSPFDGSPVTMTA